MEKEFEVEFQPPKMSFGYNFEQAQEIFEYMKLYYRMQDVKDILEEEDNPYYVTADNAGKKAMVEHIADYANEVIAESSSQWRTAVDIAIDTYETDCMVHEQEEY